MGLAKSRFDKRSLNLDPLKLRQDQGLNFGGLHYPIDSNLSSLRFEHSVILALQGTVVIPCFCMLHGLVAGIFL